MSGLSQDFRYALRQLRKSPGFTATAILMLGLGIGGNTSIFQLFTAIRLRTLPVQNPQELAEVKIVGGNRRCGCTAGSRLDDRMCCARMARDHDRSHGGVAL